MKPLRFFRRWRTDGRIPGSRYLRRRERESGATLVEAVTAIAVISIVGFALYRGFSASAFGADKGIRLVSGSQSLLILRGMLEKEIARVRVPFWETGSDGFISAAGSLTVPFLDGERDRTLSVTSANGAVTVTDGTRTFSVGVEGEVSLSFLADRTTGTVSGIEAVVKSRSGAQAKTPDGVSVRVPFGSTGIPLR